MGLITQNPKFPLAFRRRVDVVKGAAGERFPGFTWMFFTEYLAPIQLFKKSSASFASLNLLPSALNETFLSLLSVAEREASTLKLLTGLKLLISLSFSTINFTATLWTLPALNPPCWPILRHKTGLNSNPTILSTILRACWAFTRFISIVLGFCIALSIAGLVIS